MRGHLSGCWGRSCPSARLQFRHLAYPVGRHARPACTVAVGGINDNPLRMRQEDKAPCDSSPPPRRRQASQSDANRFKRHPCRSSFAVKPSRGTRLWATRPRDRVPRGRPRANAEDAPANRRCHDDSPATSGSFHADTARAEAGSCPARAGRASAAEGQPRAVVGPRQPRLRAANARINAHFCPLCHRMAPKPQDQDLDIRSKPGPAREGSAPQRAGPHRRGHSKLEASRTEKGHGQAGWAHCHCYGCQSGDR